MTAITSKVIWTPDGEKQKPQKEREEVVEEGGGVRRKSVGERKRDQGWSEKESVEEEK